MEEQKQTTAGEKKEGGKSRNHRRHYHNRNHRRKNDGSNAVKEPQEKPEGVKSAGDAEGAKQKPTQQKASSEAGEKRDGKQQNNKKRNRNHNRDRKKRDGKQGGHGPEKALYSPYEEPAPEELSLEEIRSRIVLNSAPSLNSSTPHSLREREEELPLPEIASLEDYPPVDAPAIAPVSEEEQVEVVGIRFRTSGKMYYFDPQGIQAKSGDSAIVETARGPEFGEVCLGNSMVAKSKTVSPLRPLMRVATPADIAHNEENRKKEQEALGICQERVLAHKLEMKLIDVQYAFDNSKLLFYFTADGRVDFRDLVKDLASIFRTRIELRQIGIRDEAKMLGGLGACGRALCCSTFLPDFAQVSIKMAKEQNLSLNSSKISGMCGRLMCCLRFESDVYSEEIKKTPPVDSTVKTEDGIGYVISTNPLAGTVRVVLKDTPDVAPKQYHRNDVTVLEKDRRRGQEKAKTDDQAPAE